MLIFRFKVHFKHYYGCHSRGHFSHCYCGFSPTNICQDVRFFDWICTKYGPSINDITSFSWLYDPSLFNVTTYLHKFSTPFPLNIGDVIYGKPLCAEWVLFIDLVDTYTGASIIDIIFFANFDPLTPVHLLWQIKGKKV